MLSEFVVHFCFIIHVCVVPPREEDVITVKTFNLQLVIELCWWRHIHGCCDPMMRSGVFRLLYLRRFRTRFVTQEQAKQNRRWNVHIWVTPVDCTIFHETQAIWGTTAREYRKALVYQGD